MTTMGLILEGGALRGQYTAGVLDAFLEAGVEFPYIVAVSAGASVGCSFVSGQWGRNKEIMDRYRRDSRYAGLRSWFETGSLFGMDFLFDEIPHRLVPFDFAAYQRNPARFVTVCTDCETGKALYFDKENEDSLSVLRASSSMPFVSPMVPYKGRLLLDGALTDSLPWHRAVDEGYSRNVVILTRPLGYRKKPSRWSPARWVYRRFPHLIEAIQTRWSQYNASLEAIEEAERDGRAVVIRPRIDRKVGRTERSLKKLTQLYEDGLSDGRAAILAKNLSVR